MRSLPAPLLSALSSTTVSGLVALLEIRTPTPLRYALWGRDVTYDGNVYQGTSGGFSEVTEDTEGQRTGTELSLQNVHDASGNLRPWTTLLGSLELNGVEVRIHIYHSGTDLAFTVSEWWVSGWTLDKAWAKFRAGSPHDALALLVPAAPLVAATCGKNWKQGACDGSGDFSSCPDKTVDDCRQRRGSGVALAIGPSWPYYATDARRRR